MWSVVPAMHLPQKPLTGKVAELFHCVVKVQVRFGVVGSLGSHNKLPKCWTIALISRKIASSFCPLLKSLENCCPGGVGRVRVWVCAVLGGDRLHSQLCRQTESLRGSMSYVTKSWLLTISPCNHMQSRHSETFPGCLFSDKAPWVTP